MVVNLSLCRNDWSPSNYEGRAPGECLPGQNDCVILSLCVTGWDESPEEQYDVIVTLTPKAIGHFSSRKECIAGVRKYFEKHSCEFKEELEIIDGFTARVDSRGERWLVNKGFKVSRDHELGFCGLC